MASLVASGNDGLRPIGAHVNDADISSADVLSAAAGATMLLIQASGADVRYTLDGTTPTAAVGFTLFATAEQPTLILLEDGVTVTVIEESASAILDYQWGN